MADQQRWFKFWCSAPFDDHLQRLTIPDRWAWIVLGGYTKQHGTRGSIRLSDTNATLASAMGIMAAELYVTVSRLPHISVGECVNGEFTVTWHNWRKYQEDSTVAERVSRLRSKKREEKKREESPLYPPTQPVRFPTSEGKNSLPQNGSEPTDEDYQRHEARKRAALEYLRRAGGLNPPADLP